MANITVIGNGGVAGYNTYREMKATGVAGIMIGRSMMSKICCHFKPLAKPYSKLFQYMHIVSFFHTPAFCMLKHIAPKLY